MEALKALLESDVISEALKTEIEEAWNAKVKENRLSVTAELREEFARKYEHDKSVIIESIDSMINEKLTNEMEEFHEDRKQLAEAKARYAIAMKENSNLLKRFVTESLSKEVTEFREDQKLIAEKFSVLEEFVVEQLAKEIAEFQEDKKDLAETKVRLVRESKSHLEKVKKNFIERSIKAVSSTVENGLRNELIQLKEDISKARKNDFGRKIFEAFSNEYMNSHINDKSETKKLAKLIAIKNKQIAEAKVMVEQASKIAKQKNLEIKQLKENQERIKIVNELISPLNKDQKEIMSDLLESVQTNRLRSTFEKYLPAVVDGKTPARQKAMLSEGKEITGNKENSSIHATDNNVFDIKRLAGLK